jgi:molybdopterin-guanine dinucleotide biosynthesis protein A
MRLTGVIQAGGQSTRMGGEPKALLELGGERIIERVRGALDQVTDDILIVTNTPDLYAFLGLPMVPDVFPDCGSLGGIYTGIKAAAGDAVFTVACDMPFLSPDVMRLCSSRAGDADVVAPLVDGQWETLHACYARSCLDPIERRLRERRLKITGFFDEVRVLAIPTAEVARLGRPDVVFMNVNTPEELIRARALLAETGRS